MGEALVNTDLIQTIIQIFLDENHPDYYVTHDVMGDKIVYDIRRKGSGELRLWVFAFEFTLQDLSRIGQDLSRLGERLSLKMKADKNESTN